MTNAVTHRGPDGDGYWSDELCTLGHRRLRIIDLSPTGDQPMANEDGSIQVTFNGEIYNFHSLRDELRGLGHVFRGESDTEVIVHAYEQWDTACVQRFRGMFAFALWDRKRRRLVLARDRVGKKPLFYSQQPGLLLFGSEIQALLASGVIPRDVDPDAIDAYLSFGYVPAPSTGFSSIKKLPPGHVLVLDEGARVETHAYWEIQFEPKLDLSDDEAAEALRERLTEAVRLRLISDVPLGAFLSGGIDSSIVVGLMAQLSVDAVKTFSIGFSEVAFDELAHARRVAELWGTDHHEFVVTPDALGVLPILVRHYGEPYADSSALPTYYVSQMTRQNVTVALNGDGGDESFAGYDRYWANRAAVMLAGVPGSGSAAALLKRLPDSSSSRSTIQRAKRFASVAMETMPERYSRWVGYFTPEWKKRAYLRTFSSRLNGVGSRWFEELVARSEGLDPVEAAMFVDINSYLPYDLLVKVDIASMIHSLEARSPFLDHEVMEFAGSLRPRLKSRARSQKVILKKAFRDLLPRENVARRKMGFAVPIGEWFRGPLRELLQDALLASDSRVAAYVQAEELGRLVDEHLAGKRDLGQHLWALVMLELWHRNVVEGAPAVEVAHAS